MTDQERADNLAERLSGEAYTGWGYDSSSYSQNSDHLSQGSPQLGPAVVTMPPTHPPTPDLSPAPNTPAVWNTRLNRVGTVFTRDGEWVRCLYA